MMKSMLFFAQAAALATAALLIAPERSAAQRFFYFPNGIGTPYNYYGGYSPSPFYYTYSYPAYSPTYYNFSTYIYVLPVVTTPPPPATSLDTYQGNPENEARIDVTLPPSAELWFDGKKSSQTGAVRHFATPPLMPGQSYFYDLRATWKDETGATVTRTQTVDVQAGQRAAVDLRKPE